ncbi:MAG TPA: YraN family protein [bacterium]|nr:YraN family protein [bacterium]HOL46554.1 YraN family protein [bacterium]HPQ17875.1 YraN family protein [bacterium]
MKSKNQIIGLLAEKCVGDFFQNNNFIILQKNFSWKFGEIDIIAQKNNVIHFIEVKKRDYVPDDLNLILPKHKINSLKKTAHYFIDFYNYDIKTNIFQFDLALIVNDNLYFYENIFETK